MDVSLSGAVGGVLSSRGPAAVCSTCDSTACLFSLKRLLVHVLLRGALRRVAATYSQYLWFIQATAWSNALLCAWRWQCASLAWWGTVFTYVYVSLCLASTDKRVQHVIVVCACVVSVQQFRAHWHAIGHELCCPPCSLVAHSLLCHTYPYRGNLHGRLQH